MNLHPFKFIRFEDEDGKMGFIVTNNEPKKTVEAISSHLKKKVTAHKVWDAPPAVSQFLQGLSFLSLSLGINLYDGVQALIQQVIASTWQAARQDLTDQN